MFMAEYVHLTRGPTPKMFKLGKYSFSLIEIKHLAFAMLMIILTIYVFQNGARALLDVFSSFDILKFFLIYVLTIGLGFLLHELGHKLVAQHYGFISEFRADFQMLFFMFLLAVFSPLIFLAPGAVMILGRPTRKQNGIISVAGPVVNLVLAFIFLLVLILFSPSVNSLIFQISYLGIWINAFLGVFNMLPFWVLDGKKVLAWSKPIYFTVMGLLILFLVLSFNGTFI